MSTVVSEPTVTEPTAQPTESTPSTPPAVQAATKRDAPPARGGLSLTPLSAAIMAVGALILIAAFVLIYAFGLSAVQEHRAQAQRYGQLRGLLDPASQVAPPTGGVIAPGTPIALINAPAAHLSNLVVLEGTSSSDLQSGPGHLRDTSLPGQLGASVVLGRSVTAGAPFRSLASLRAGDDIHVVTGQGHFVYRVADQRVSGDKLPVVASGQSLLVLETSAGSGWLGPFTRTHVLYVDAVLQGKAVTASAAHVYAVPADELPGHNDPAAWPYVILWLQGLLVAGASVTWLSVRWGRWQTWLVGTPVLLGLLWGFTTEAVRLLPNLV